MFDAYSWQWAKELERELAQLRATREGRWGAERRRRTTHSTDGSAHGRRSRGGTAWVRTIIARPGRTALGDR